MDLNLTKTDSGSSVAFVPQEPEYGVLEVTQDDLIAKSYAYVYLNVNQAVRLWKCLGKFIEESKESQQ